MDTSIYIDREYPNIHRRVRLAGTGGSMGTTIHLLARAFYQESISRLIANINAGIEVIDRKEGIRAGINENNSGHLYLIESQYLISNYISETSTTPILFIGALKELHRIFDIPQQSKGGYITPADGFEVLPGAIKKIIKGEWFISPRTQSFLESNRLQQQRKLLHRKLSKPLSRSELEILFEIACGNTTSGIAQKRFRSVHTVKTQRKEIRRKLSLTDQYNLNILAARKLGEIKTLYSIVNDPEKLQLLLKNTA
ncbi:MAG TPA: LuxR C-terminal-related transcriptional regulator [Balneolales bacterium]|nr:LuxR C-terminal-related transcriptional regulator [Balneolales bacterium]